MMSEAKVLKKLRAEVDVLTLTATPIPRTLAMSLEGIRSFSVIATAPEKRLAIKTIVRKETPEVIREAVMRELKRGGQVYFLHNDVSTIENRREQLTQLIPEARIVVGHGQMNERELESVMRDFYQQRYNVLLCTTIIETGIDVPTANTIIMHRADKFGLAQLHQLRGRVGRSHHQAYAYLLTPGNMMPYPRKREILYDGIVFTGKTLKRVFYPHALVSHPTEEGQIVLYQDDTMVYHFEVDGVQYTLRVNSDATQGTRNHGIYMINENIRLQLTFSKQQTAADIKKHYSFRRYIARYCFLLYQGFIFSTISFNWTFLNFLFTFRHSMQLLVSLMLYHTIILTIFKLIYLLLESDFSKSTEN